VVVQRNSIKYVPISLIQCVVFGKNAHLKVSDVLLPESAVLDGFVPLSKLNVFGLSECGDAVVEFAIHNLESVIVFCMVVLAVVEEYAAPLLPGTVALVV
jgi:hypothetical protein